MTCPHCGTTGNYQICEYTNNTRAAVCNGCKIHMCWLPSGLTDTSIMTFGKQHRGKALANVPAEYFLWMKDNVPNMPPDIRQYIMENLDVLMKQAK